MRKIKKLCSVLLIFTLLVQALPIKASAHHYDSNTNNVKIYNIDKRKLEKVLYILSNMTERMLETKTEAQIEAYLNGKGIYFFENEKEVDNFKKTMQVALDQLVGGKVLSV